MVGCYDLALVVEDARGVAKVACHAVGVDQQDGRDGAAKDGAKEALEKACEMKYEKSCAKLKDG